MENINRIAKRKYWRAGPTKIFLEYKELGLPQVISKDIWYRTTARRIKYARNDLSHVEFEILANLEENDLGRKTLFASNKEKNIVQRPLYAFKLGLAVDSIVISTVYARISGDISKLIRMNCIPQMLLAFAELIIVLLQSK